MLIRSMYRVISKLKTVTQLIFTLIKNSTPIYAYRIISIEIDEDNNHICIIQVVNKKQTLSIRPEEILSNDSLLNLFSPMDIRALTYLGYLSINSPKYRILAKRLSENDNKLFFALKIRGIKKPIVKTADQISTDEQILEGLHQKDAHMIGYATATEQVIQEQNQKQKLLAKYAK